MTSVDCKEDRSGPGKRSRKTKPNRRELMSLQADPRPPNGHDTTNAYDAEGQVINVTDPLSHVTTYSDTATGKQSSRDQGSHLVFGDSTALLCARRPPSPLISKVDRRTFFDSDEGGDVLDHWGANVGDLPRRVVNYARL